ncbi:hypothetical protein ACFIQG_04510 [Comamonas odontotermitis]
MAQRLPSHAKAHASMANPMHFADHCQHLAHRLRKRLYNQNFPPPKKT